ncbi:type VI secretion system baseplate subunit TssK [Marinimicrobium alkaliphilum]|uniref:type VI secretion system baseplate subunit TssK n=1 Tax=Marinimicrobium alkaliphilum TaxID=2202654 RepID=UPI000DB92868|nr:type VI secretion system baseplate subunit TssK [Marinimicrobium alkaliphilum]
MSLSSKVIWSEGMFLNPQHFQQYDRYVERYVDAKCSALGVHAWGLQAFELDQQLLKLGKLSVLRGQGVFPDGTPFNFPDVDDAPAVLALPEGVHDTLVYLTVPVRRPGAVDVSRGDDSQALARYYVSEMSTRDCSAEGGDTRPVDIGKLRVRLMLETEDLSGYACIGVLRIAETRDDGNVLLDEQFIPACLDCSAAPRLNGFIPELGGLLHHRGEAIAGRLADARRGGSAEIADYMMLQMINRFEPLINHLVQLRNLHPLALYQLLLQMAGEFATFVAKTKRPPEFAPYRHDDLQASFGPLWSTLRTYLSMVYEQTATALQLEEKKYGIRVATITDRSLLDSGSFVLAVRADVSEEVLRSRLPGQIKIGPVERIRQLVNAAMPGIAIRPLPVAPRQIPYRSGYAYFELDKQGAFWPELKTSGGFALHVGGDFPGLEMEFWAIRQ